jgi:DNA-binding transcriptional LysR family regulator
MGVALVPASMRHLRYRGVVYRSLRGRPPAPDTAVAWRRGEETPTVNAFLRVVRAVADHSGDTLDRVGPVQVEPAPVPWRNGV